MAKMLEEIEINAEMFASLIRRLYEEKRRVSEHPNALSNGERLN